MDDRRRLVNGDDLTLELKIGDAEISSTEVLSNFLWSQPVLSLCQRSVARIILLNIM